MSLPADEAALRFADRQRETRRIKEMLEEGLRKKEAALELGRSTVTVWRRLKEAEGERFGHDGKRLEKEG
jgi:predicted DNA-binding protein (UPF0251 family)